MAPTIRVIDRRRLTGVDLEGSEVLASLRVTYEWPGSRWHRDVLATRGERLALLRCRARSQDGAAVLAELEYVEIVEVDSAGRGVLDVDFDSDDLDAAYAELDARFAAGEGAPHAELLANLRAYVQAFGARDDDTIRHLLSADLTVFDRRRLVGTEGQVSRDEWFASYDLGELELFDLEQLDAAFARFAELCAETESRQSAKPG